MSDVSQLLGRALMRRSRRTAIRNAVRRVIRANKDIAAAVATLEKTMSRREAVTQVVYRNPALQAALMQELAKLLK